MVRLAGGEVHCVVRARAGRTGEGSDAASPSPECGGGDVMHQLSERQRVGRCPAATAHRLQTHTQRERGGDQIKKTQWRASRAREWHGRAISESACRSHG